MKDDYLNESKYNLVVFSIYINKFLKKNTNVGTIIKCIKYLNIDFFKEYSYLDVLYILNNFEELYNTEDVNDSLNNFISSFNQYKTYSKEDLEDELLELLAYQNKDIVKIAVIKDLYQNNFFFDITIRIIFGCCESFKYENTIQNIINDSLLVECENDSFEEIFSEIDKVIAEAFHIKNIKDLKYADSRCILLTFSNINSLGNFISKKIEDEEIIYNSTLNLCYIENYDINLSIVIDKIQNILESFNDKELDIIFGRSEFCGSKFTLEELGKKYGITRERVRQLDKKLLDKIKILTMRISEIIECYLFNNLKTNTYIFPEEFKIIIGDENVFKTIGVMVENNICNHFRYVSDFGIICVKDLFDDTVSEIISKYDNIVPNKEYELSPLLDKKIIENSYKCNSNGTFLKRGMVGSDIFCYIIEKIFPEGISMTNDNINVINEYISDNFGDMEPINIHALQANIVRKNYRNIDRGTYLHMSKIPQLSIELREKIVNYVLKSKTTLYYSSIYDIFKIELNDENIKNRYHFKSVLDPFLPVEVVTQKDYLCSSDEFISSQAKLSNIINETQGPFTYASLKNSFPGIEDYVLTSALTNENVIALEYMKLYITRKNVIVSDELKKIIKICPNRL